MSSNSLPSSQIYETTHSTEIRKLPSADIAMRAMGRGLSLAMFYLVVFGSVFTHTMLSGYESIIGSCIGLAIVLALNALCLRFNAILKNERLFFGIWIPTLVFVVVGLWGMVVTYFNISIGWLAYAIYAVASLCSGYIVMMNARCELVYDKNTVASRCGASFLVFGVVMLISYLLDPFSIQCLTVGCSVVIACFNSIVLSGGDQQKNQIQDDRKSASSLKLHRWSLVSFGITSMVLSFELLTTSIFEIEVNIVGLMGVGVLGAMVACLVIGKLKGDAYFLQGPVGRITMPILIASILLVQLIPPPYRLIALIVMYIALFMRDLSRIMNRVLLASEYNISLSWLIARTMFPWMAGLFVGALWAVLWMNVNEYWMPLLGAILASVFISVGESLIPYGADPLIMPVTVKDPDIQWEREENKKSYWKVALSDMAEQSALTAREREVLILLSRGRTATVIAERLNISINTVKTHIYNIYRKTNMNNQQTLIDEIENRRQELLKAMGEPQERL